MKPPETTKPKGTGRIVYLSYLILAIVAATLIAPWIKSISINYGEQTFALEAGHFRNPGPNAPARSGFFSDGWTRMGRATDGPTHEQFYEFLLRDWGYRLDMLEDPMGAAQRRLPKTIPGLIHSLDSKNWFTRLAVADGLTKRGIETIPFLPDLIARLQSDNEDSLVDPIEKIAATDLNRSLPILTNALLRSDFITSVKVAEVLGGLGTNALPAIPAIKETLLRNSPWLQWSAALTLSKIDSNRDFGVPVLASLLTNEFASNRTAAAYVLGEFSSVATPAVPQLQQALKDPDTNVRAMTARTLGMIGPPARPAIPSLIFNLSDTNPDVLRWSMTALGQIGPEAKAAIPRLAEFVNQEMWDLDRTSIEALGGLGPDAAAVLLEVFKIGSTKNRGFAAFSLAKIGPAATNALPVLIETLDDDSNGNVYLSLRVLAHYGPAAKPAMPKILQLMKDEDENVRLHAARAAWKIDFPKKQVIPMFIEALRDNSENRYGPRRTAIIGLGEIGFEAKEALPLLQAIAVGTDPRSRNSIQDDAQTGIDRIDGQNQPDDSLKFIGWFLK